MSNDETTPQMIRPDKVNHGYAEHLAESIRWRYNNAFEAMDQLIRELRNVEKDDYVGVIPPEVLAALVYDTDETPLSVHPDAAFCLQEMGREAGALLADVTDRPIWSEDEWDEMLPKSERTTDANSSGGY